MAGAFDGIGVIDFTEGRAGPYAGMLLAEQGADVIKVEPPAGDRARGTPAFYVLNRSKRGIVLDLTSREGRARARGLAAAADVVLVDQLPQAAKRLGIDYASLTRENAELVYCSMPPYGSKGPLATLEPDDALVAAVTGVLGLQWSYADSPVFLVVPIVAYATGVLAALAVAATLFDRARGGHGDHIEVSGLGGAFALQPASYILPLGALEVIRLSAGKITPRGPWPTYRVYEASDGEWFFLGALTPVFWTKLAVALGLEEYLADPRFESAPTGYKSPEDAQELSDRLAQQFATKPRRHWLDFLREADVPAGPVQTRDDYFDDPQVLHNGMRMEIEDPEVGPTVQMGVPLLLRETPGGIRGPAPSLGQHNDVALTTPPPARAAAAPAAKGKLTGRPPLGGITVLELGTILAGPYAAMLLSDLGANVIKTEPLDGDPWRSVAISFLGVNRGKRGLAINLKNEQGLDAFYDLVRNSDAVVDNSRAGVLQRLKIDYEALSAVNPRIICASITGFGASGPMAGLPGFDPLLQARSGLMRAQGGDGEEPVYHQIAVCDFVTGLMTAFGVAAALYVRERSGRGQQVETSLANNAMAAQAGEFVRYQGRPPDPPGGRDLAGVSALYRIYRCADGWLFLAVRTPEQAMALVRATGGALAARAEHAATSLLEAPVQGDAAAALEAFFAGKQVDETVHLLTQQGIPCAPCLTIQGLFDDEHLKANDLWWEMEHPDFGPMRQTGRVVKWGRRSMRLERPAPLLGQHSREVLLELGVDFSRIEELIGEGVVGAPVD